MKVIECCTIMQYMARKIPLIRPHKVKKITICNATAIFIGLLVNHLSTLLPIAVLKLSHRLTDGVTLHVNLTPASRHIIYQIICHVLKLILYTSPH